MCPLLLGIGSNAVLASETIYAAAGVDELLLTSEKRMTLGAKFHAQLFLYRTGLKSLSASADDFSLIIIGMDFLFHVGSPLSWDYSGIIARTVKGCNRDEYL
jgi:hypothetical protein